MIYFEDDIVEILNAGCKLQWLNPPRNSPDISDYIGQRFRVVNGPFNHNFCVEIDWIRGRDNGFPEMAPNQIMLYHRPFKNHLKYWWYVITKKGKKPKS